MSITLAQLEAAHAAHRLDQLFAEHRNHIEVEELPDGWEVRPHRRGFGEPEADLIAVHMKSGVMLSCTVETLRGRVDFVDSRFYDLPPAAPHRIKGVLTVFLLEDHRGYREKYFVMDASAGVEVAPSVDVMWEHAEDFDWREKGILTPTNVPVDLAPVYTFGEPGSLEIEHEGGIVVFADPVQVHFETNEKAPPPVVLKALVARANMENDQGNRIVVHRAAFSAHQLRAAGLTSSIPVVHSPSGGPDRLTIERPEDVQRPVPTAVEPGEAIVPPSPRRVPGRPAGQQLSDRPTRQAVEVMGNPDVAEQDGAAVIDVLARLMRDGYEYSDALAGIESLEALGLEKTYPNAMARLAALGRPQAGRSLWHKDRTGPKMDDVPPPYSPADDIPF